MDKFLKLKDLISTIIFQKKTFVEILNILIEWERLVFLLDTVHLLQELLLDLLATNLDIKNIMVFQTFIS